MNFMNYRDSRHPDTRLENNTSPMRMPHCQGVRLIICMDGSDGTWFVLQFTLWLVYPSWIVKFD